MMHAIAAGLDQSEAVMAGVDMKEVGAKRLLHVVAEAEPQYIDVEWHHRVDMLDRKHGVAEAERAGAEAGNRDFRLPHRPARPRPRRAYGRAYRRGDAILRRCTGVRPQRLHAKAVSRLLLSCQRPPSQPRSDRDRPQWHASSDGRTVFTRRCRPVL